MRYMAADDPRAVVFHKSLPVRELCKLTAMRLRLGPALVPVIRECAVKAADCDKEDAY